MNTNPIMTSSALFLGVSGIILTFVPEVVLRYLGVEVTPPSLLLGQVVGALYFGFGMLNWMAKGSAIGGIYNRPIVIANFSHFMIAGLAILKQLLVGSGSVMLWLAGVVYTIFGLLFVMILFRNPLPPSASSDGGKIEHE